MATRSRSQGTLRSRARRATSPRAGTESANEFGAHPTTTEIDDDLRTSRSRRGAPSRAPSRKFKGNKPGQHAGRRRGACARRRRRMGGAWSSPNKRLLALVDVDDRVARVQAGTRRPAAGALPRRLLGRERDVLGVARAEGRLASRQALRARLQASTTMTASSQRWSRGRCFRCQEEAARGLRLDQVGSLRPSAATGRASSAPCSTCPRAFGRAPSSRASRRAPRATGRSP